MGSRIFPWREFFVVTGLEETVAFSGQGLEETAFSGQGPGMIGSCHI